MTTDVLQIGFNVWRRLRGMSAQIVQRHSIKVADGLSACEATWDAML